MISYKYKRYSRHPPPANRHLPPATCHPPPTSPPPPRPPGPAHRRSPLPPTTTAAYRRAQPVRRWPPPLTTDHRAPPLTATFSVEELRVEDYGLDGLTSDGSAKSTAKSSDGVVAGAASDTSGAGMPYHQLSFGSVPLPLPPGSTMGAALPFAVGSPAGGGAEPTFSFGVGGSGASGSRKKQGKKKAPTPSKAATGAELAQGGAGDDVAKTFVFVPSVAASPVAMEVAEDSPKVIHDLFLFVFIQLFCVDMDNIQGGEVRGPAHLSRARRVHLSEHPPTHAPTVTLSPFSAGHRDGPGRRRHDVRFFRRVATHGRSSRGDVQPPMGPQVHVFGRPCRSKPRAAHAVDGRCEVLCSPPGGVVPWIARDFGGCYL